MSSERCSVFDFVRAMSNVLVVLLHAWAAFQYCQMNGVEFGFWRCVKTMSQVLLPTLFLLSGYLAAQDFSYKRFGLKLLNRVRRLVVPYVAWNVLFAIVYLLVASVVPRIAVRVETWGIAGIEGFLSKTIGPVAHPIDGPLWFLRAVFVYFLLVPFLIWLIRGLRVWGVCSVLLIGVIWHLAGCERALHSAYPYYSFFAFVLGVWLAENRITPMRFFSRRWWCISTLVGFFVLLVNAILDDQSISWMLASVGMFLMIPSWWAFADVLCARFEGNGLIRLFYGANGFFVYAGHFLFCSILLHSFASLIPGHFPGKFSLLVLVFLCGVPVMVVCRSILSRMCLPLLRVFDGTL